MPDRLELENTMLRRLLGRHRDALKLLLSASTCPYDYPDDPDFHARQVEEYNHAHAVATAALGACDECGVEGGHSSTCSTVSGERLG